jgi:hypothetical protein
MTDGFNSAFKVLNLMFVLDDAVHEELVVHRLSGRLCGCHYDKGLMNGGE